MENFSILSAEQELHPQSAIDEIFEYAHSSDLKEALWQWYKATANGGFQHLRHADRSEITTTYEFMVKLVTAADLLRRPVTASPFARSPR